MIAFATSAGKGVTVQSCRLLKFARRSYFASR
jgi:hypothetical protein